MSQKLHFIIDTFTSEDSDVCDCKRGGTCTCEPGQCHCNHVKYDTIYITLPPAFINSNNYQKKVSILQVRLFDLTSNTEITGSLHSDLVQVDSSADNYCCSTNKLYPIPPTFIIGGRQSKFSCWARSISGELIDFDRHKTRIILELLLEF